MARRIAVAAWLVLAPACSRATEPKLRIGSDDCAKWAAHGVKTTIDDWKAATARCPVDTQRALAEKLDGQRATIERLAVDLCSNHVGEEYAADDARCYLAASTTRALANCKFNPLRGADDDAIASQIEQVQASCASPPP